MPLATPGQAVDLRPLVAAELADSRQRNMLCPAGCNRGWLLDSTLVQQQGDVQLLHLVRLGHHGTVGHCYPMHFHTLTCRPW